MKRKLLLRKLSISAPTMKVRSEFPLPVKIIIWVVSLVLCSVIVLLAYDMGRSFAGIDSDVWIQLTKPENAAEPKLNQLSEQIKALETENSRLKEDLAYFNTLLPTNTGTSGITIQRFDLEPVLPNQLRFRTLVMQGGGGKQRFSGKLLIVVTAQQGNETVNLVFPSDKFPDHDKYKLGFKHYQRLEGILTLPDGATVNNVQARIIENGQVRAQKETVTLVKNNSY